MVKIHPIFLDFHDLLFIENFLECDKTFKTFNNEPKSWGKHSQDGDFSPKKQTKEIDSDDQNLGTGCPFLRQNIILV